MELATIWKAKKGNTFELRAADAYQLHCIGKVIKRNIVSIEAAKAWAASNAIHVITN